MALGSSALGIITGMGIGVFSIMASCPFGPSEPPVKLSEGSSSTSDTRSIASVSSRLTGLNMVSALSGMALAVSDGRFPSAFQVVYAPSTPPACVSLVQFERIENMRKRPRIFLFCTIIGMAQVSSLVSSKPVGLMRRRRSLTACVVAAAQWIRKLRSNIKIFQLRLRLSARRRPDRVMFFS